MKPNASRLWRGHIVILACIVACLSVTDHMDAAIFVKIPSVPGDHTVLGDPGHIEILSWSWGETNDGAVAALNDLSIVLPVGVSTPKLVEHLCAGKEIEAVTLTTVIEAPPGGAGKTSCFVIKLRPVYISSYQTGGSAGDVVPIDQFSLNFEKIESTYKEISADGSVRESITRECEKPAITP